MRAVVLRSYGGPEVLTFEDVPDPSPGPDEVVVDVAATALNRADLLQRMGLYPDPRRLQPEIPGLEFAGTVIERGSRATMWQVGDRVMGIEAGGAYAERIATHERQLLAVPAGIDLVDAAGIPEVFLTAWDALVLQGGLTSGRWALVHAGGSGVGTAAIQIAKAIGARVITTAKAGDHEFVRSLGADAAIDFTSTDYVDAVAEMTAGSGVDVVFDTIGGDALTRSPLTLADFGRVVSIVDIAQPQNLIDAWGKNAAYHFVFTRQNRGKLDALTTLVERGLVKPVIGATLPLARMGEAHELLENRRSYALRGKVAVDVAGDTVDIPSRIS